MNPNNLTKIRSKLIMSFAEGQHCTLRVASLYPGHRCSDGTVVGAHLPVWGKGMSTKPTDCAVAYACMACHDIVDVERDMVRGNYIREKYPLAFGDRLLRGLTETHALLLEAGIMSVKDGVLI